MNRLEDPRYDLIYLNTDEDAQSSLLSEENGGTVVNGGVVVNKEQPESEACSAKEDKEGGDEEGEEDDVDDDEEEEEEVNSGSSASKVQIDLEVENSKKNNSKPTRKDDGFYYCRYCEDFRSWVKRDLMRHELKHTGEKPYKCKFESCNKKFTRAQHLSRHMWWHTGKKPFECEFCENKYTRKDRLVSHLKVHTHLHQCSICRKRFVDREDCDVHEKLHNDLTPYEPTTNSTFSEEGLHFLGFDVKSEDVDAEELEFGLDFPKEAFEKIEVDVDCGTVGEQTPPSSETDCKYNCKYCSYSSSHRSHVESHERTHTEGCNEMQTGVEPLEGCEENGLHLENAVNSCGDVAQDGGEDEESQEEPYPESIENLEINIDSFILIDKNPSPLTRRVYRCRFCDNFITNNRTKFVDHVRGHTGQKYKCAHCDSTFSRKFHLTRHLKMHSGALPFECPTCHRKFGRKDHMNKHMDTHDKGMVLRSADIKVDVEEGSVGNGEQSGEPQRRKRMRCSMCPRTFNRKFHYRKHMQTHKKNLEKQKQLEMIAQSENIEGDGDVCQEKEEQCAAEGESSKEEQIEIEIANYMMVDRNPTDGTKKKKKKTKAREYFDYKCRFCADYTCKTKSELKAHEETHPKDRPYECNLCHAKFSRLQHLTRHMRLHTGERPFGCLLCEKTFARKDHLDKHMTVHTGLRPYECQLCPKTFARHYLLTRHNRKHMEEAQ